jgi:hypothetical protein
MKTPRGYKRMANGKLTKAKPVAHKKKAQKRKHTKRKKKGKGVATALMSVGKAILPSLLAGLVVEQVTKKRGGGLKLLGMK